MGSIGIRASEGKDASMNVNGAEIYHEVRGCGPSVLFISGATGDAGHFERVAELLANEFTTITYDRRGNSRSPRPVGWDSTSTEQQADDAAGLLEALGLAPAAVFTTSGGALIGLNLVIRHPEALRGAILHEPPIMSVLARPEEVMGPIRQMVEESMKRGSPRAAVEAFVRFAAGDENFENLDSGLRERMLGNGETLFGIEFGTFESYRPTDEALAEVEVPVQVAIGTESAPFFGEAARWLADRLGVETVALTGAHTPYLDHPEEMVQKIRPFLRRVSQPELSARVQPGREKVMNRKETPMIEEDQQGEMAPDIESVELPTGVTLQYVEQGEASGVPVLLLHGLSDSWHSFELVLPHLPESTRAFALTQRGHGDSSRPEAGYRFHDFSADVAAFMDALHLEAAVIVGHSLGSSVAQRFAIDHPKRTLGLVLVGSFASLAENPVARELWDSVISTMEDPVDPGFVREFQESTLAQPVPQDFLETIVQESLKLPARVWRAVGEGSLQDGFSGELNKIEAPTLLVWGDRDGMIPRSEQDVQTAAIAGSRLVVYEGAGHGVHWEEPERFASDLVSFIETSKPIQLGGEADALKRERRRMRSGHSSDR